MEPDGFHSVVEGGARMVDRVLIVGSVALILGTLWWSWSGALPGAGVRVLATLAAGCLIIGGFAVGRGTRPAFTLLWAALGASLALGVIGILSIGMVYIVASILIILAIMATSNHSDLPSRFDGRYVWMTGIVFTAVFATAMLYVVGFRAGLNAAER
jgi:hypothetical protein